MARNSFGVATRPLDETDPFATTTQTYHGFSIEVNGVIIGRISEWTPQQLSRPSNLIRELNRETFGRPVDIVPAIDENFNLAFTRAEVWGEEIEIAFGETTPYSLLTDQTRPFIVRETLFRGRTPYRIWTHLGCWFTEKSPQAFSADADGIIKVSCNLMFVNKIRSL